MTAASHSRQRTHVVWRAPARSAPAPSIVAPMPFNETLGIKTQVYRIPVLGHFQHAGVNKRDRYDPVTETWSADHLFRASITLAKV